MSSKVASLAVATQSLKVIGWLDGDRERILVMSCGRRKPYEAWGEARRFNPLALESVFVGVSGGWLRSLEEMKGLEGLLLFRKGVVLVLRAVVMLGEDPL